jgi:para-aminobenzoate synthetase/4-amino-4-deoxychorismate lyase
LHEARFDALGSSGAGRSFVFRELRRVVTAARVEDVVPALREVEAAVAGGMHAAGFVAYEAAPAFDPALAVRPADPTLPLLRFGLFPRREEAPPLPAAGDGAFDLGAWTPSVSADAYREAVERIRGLIAAGDTYQVNHTFRLRAPFRGDPAALYARLCQAQRSDFCALLRFDGTAIVSASPELFFRWADGALELRPMKGTRPRGRWPAEDDALAAELLASPKERAENVMIVDLLRNDAGRVAEFGSVRVERLFDVERYETVHQLTSTIRAQTRPEVGLPELFAALFPCGSVTGAPKVRTSEIIAALECSPRGAYCGAIGFASPGEAVFSVGIRTLRIDEAAGTAELGVGSGVTHDSRADDEYRECLAKAEFARRAPHDVRLLETLLWDPADGFWLLNPHLWRLDASARYLGFALDEREIRDALDRAVSTADRSRRLRVRLLVSRDGTAEAQAAALVPSPEPVRVAFSPVAVDAREPLLYHKTTRRDVYEQAAAARPDADDVLLLNERGEVTESTIANVVAEIGGVRWTPPQEAGLLPGVLRGVLLSHGEIRERTLTPDDLRAADALWLINSVRGWRRAALID